MFHPMKPETIARRAREREEEARRSRERLRARLEEAAEREGPGGIFSELLAEHMAARP